MAGTLLNIAIAPFLIFERFHFLGMAWSGMDLGVAGAGIATMLSNAATAAVVIAIYLRGHTRLKLRLRPDWRERRSPFNDRNAAASAFARLLDRLDAPHVLVSYSTDGLIPVERLVATAAGHGALSVFCTSYKRYRVSPTRPSPRPRNVEFVLAVDRRQRVGTGADRALREIRNCSLPG